MTDVFLRHFAFLLEELSRLCLCTSRAKRRKAAATRRCGASGYGQVQKLPSDMHIWLSADAGCGRGAAALPHKRSRIQTAANVPQVGYAGKPEGE